jgi:predicted small secreted protein
MAKAFAMLAILAPALVLTACNTTRGIARDVKSVGKAVERAVD